MDGQWGRAASSVCFQEMLITKRRVCIYADPPGVPPGGNLSEKSGDKRALSPEYILTCLYNYLPAG